MSKPPALRPQTLRPSPANGETLRRDIYDLRAHDGSFICRVERHKAEAGIADGTLELRNGPHGAYLRPARRDNGPERNPNAGNSRTWFGPRSPELGKVSRYRPNEAVCIGWKQPDIVSGVPPQIGSTSPRARGLKSV